MPIQPKTKIRRNVEKKYPSHPPASTEAPKGESEVSKQITHMRLADNPLSTDLVFRQVRQAETAAAEDRKLLHLVV